MIAWGPASRVSIEQDPQGLSRTIVVDREDGSIDLVPESFVTRITIDPAGE